MEMKIPSITARRQDVPPDLERIVMRALERDRKRRFATAAEMARALDDFILASQLHVEDVAAFIRDIETLSGPPRLVYVNPERARSDEAATRRDRGMRLAHDGAPDAHAAVRRSRGAGADDDRPGRRVRAAHQHGGGQGTTRRDRRHRVRSVAHAVSRGAASACDEPQLRARAAQVPPDRIWL